MWPGSKPVWKVCIVRGRYCRAIWMLSIYLLLNFQNLRHAISKLSSQGSKCKEETRANCIVTQSFHMIFSSKN